MSTKLVKALPQAQTRAYGSQGHTNIKAVYVAKLNFVDTAYLWQIMFADNYVKED